MMVRGDISRHSRTKGLSLVEMLVTIAITTLVFTAVTGGIVFFYRTNAYGIEQTFAIASARRGVENMVEDIREATFSETGAFPVISMGANSLSFYSDIDADNLVERVEYALSDTELQKTILQPPTYAAPGEVEIVGEGIRNVSQGTSIFRYFNEEGVEIVDYGNVAEVVFVQVNLVVNVNPNRLPNEFTLRSSARLRNLPNY